MPLHYWPAISANFNIALFEFNGACMQSADELKLHKLERKDTLWVAYGVLYTDTWQYCLSETLDVTHIYIYIYICLFNDHVSRSDCSSDGQLGVN
jgi:hypothetical protein